MKHRLILLFVVLGFSGFSQQVPQRINYQGIARQSDGNPIINRNIALRFRILQGSASGSQVFAENQSLNTGSLGVFSHQIGSVNTLTVVNWANGPFFLEVEIDTTNGSSFVVMGTQQLISAPYALYAGGAPSPTLAFNPANNILNVGTNTVSIPTGTNSSPSGSTGIITTGALTSTLNGINYTLFTPSVTVNSALFSPGVAAGLAQVTGSFPNYTVMVAPVIAYNPTVGVLELSSIPLTSPAYNYTYNITPGLSINGNTLFSGPPSNSVLIPTGTFVATPNTTLNSSGGLINITQSGTNNFDINVAPVSIQPGGSASVTGTYPNFTVSAPAVAASSVNITQSGAITVTGTNPNFTVFTPSVNVTQSAGGLASVNGTFPNYVVNVTPTFSYNNVAGAMVVSNSSSPSISYTYNMTPTLNFNAGILTSGPSSNSVSIPAAVIPTITGLSAVSVTASGSNFTVSVPVTTVVSGSGVSVTGTAPNFTVSATNSASITGNGAATVSTTGNSYTVSVPVTTLVGTGAATVLGTAPNFTIDAPPAATISGSGAATVNALANNYTVTVPITTVVGTGGAVVSGSAPNFTVNSPQQVNLTPAGGGISTSGVYPNITLTSPSVAISPSLSIMPTPGLLQKFGTYPNYSLVVAPVIGYNAVTGVLSLTNMPFSSPYSYTYNVTPNLGVSNNVITSGPVTNSVAIVSPAAQVFPVSGNGSVIAGGVIIMPTAFTKQSTSSEIDVFVHAQVNVGVSLGNFKYEVVIDGNTSLVSAPHTVEGTLSLGGKDEYITLKAVFSGLSAGSHTVGIKVTGALGIGTTLDPNGYGAKLILKETY